MPTAENLASDIAAVEISGGADDAAAAKKKEANRKKRDKAKEKKRQAAVAATNAVAASAKPADPSCGTRLLLSLVHSATESRIVRNGSRW